MAGKGAERVTTGLKRPPAGCSGALMVWAHGKGGVQVAIDGRTGLNGAV